jgi:hypothetical protein
MIYDSGRLDPEQILLRIVVGSGSFGRSRSRQAIYGKVLRNVEEVRHAVGKFVEDYNAQRPLHKSLLLVVF